jgi:hypothetical protein
MQERTLFGIIAVLLFSIAGLGAYAAFSHPSDVAAIPGSAARVVDNAVVNATNTVVQAASSVVNDHDFDGDASGDNDEDGDGATVTTQTQTSVRTETTQSSTAGTYTMAQVAQHANASSCYTAINGSVYDLTSFVNQHPGGAGAILSLCGRDGTASFEAQHGGQRRPESELASLKIGTLAQ